MGVQLQCSFRRFVISNVLVAFNRVQMRVLVDNCGRALQCKKICTTKAAPKVLLLENDANGQCLEVKI